jgi:hypothetical protein
MWLSISSLATVVLAGGAWSNIRVVMLDKAMAATTDAAISIQLGLLLARCFPSAASIRDFR